MVKFKINKLFLFEIFRLVFKKFCEGDIKLDEVKNDQRT